MRGFLVTVALAAVAMFVGSDTLWAHGRRGGCGTGCGGGHRHHRGHGGGCGGGCCGGCHSGCGMGCGSGCCGGGCYSGCMSGCGMGCGSGCGGGYYAYAALPSDVMVAQSEDAEASITLVVDVPEDARLLVDDYVTASSSTQRVFASPPVRAGQDYIYTLRAEVVRDGQVQTVTRDVTVRAGEEKHVSLEVPTMVASAE